MALRFIAKAISTLGIALLFLVETNRVLDQSGVLSCLRLLLMFPPPKLNYVRTTNTEHGAFHASFLDLGPIRF